MDKAHNDDSGGSDNGDDDNNSNHNNDRNKRTLKQWRQYYSTTPLPLLHKSVDFYCISVSFLEIAQKQSSIVLTQRLTPMLLISMFDALKQML